MLNLFCNFLLGRKRRIKIVNSVYLKGLFWVQSCFSFMYTTLVVHILGGRLTFFMDDTALCYLDKYLAIKIIYWFFKKEEDYYKCKKKKEKRKKYYIYIIFSWRVQLLREVTY